MNRVQIKRGEDFVEYEVQNAVTLLQALEEIEKIDPSLEYDSGCRSGVCGSCAVRVDGKEVLACQCALQKEQKVQPLRHTEVIKDLRVTRASHTLKDLHLHQYSNATIDDEAVQKISLQSDCILCGCCYSACPVLEVNSEFLGPFALTKVLRYVDDAKESDSMGFIDKIQTHGIWDCTLCGECALVCPQGINSKIDIMELRNKSVQSGYSDPNFQTMSFGNFGF